MVIAIADGCVLLEKRSPTGIWGGLLSFPEYETVKQALSAVRARLGGEIRLHRELPLLKHGFTHYSLTITPLVCEVEHKACRVAETGDVWMSLAAALEVSIPKPVRTLITRVQEDALGLSLELLQK